MCGTLHSVSTLLITVGRAERADDRRERRLHARLAALAFERLEHAGLLAADVGARAAVDVHVELEARAHDAVAEDAVLVRLLDRPLQDLRRLRVLAADVDVAGVGLHRPAADRAPLDELVRVVLHEEPVLERARLGLVGVADQVLGLSWSLGMKLHLRPAEKPAPPRPRRPDFLTSSMIASGSILSALASAS